MGRACYNYVDEAGVGHGELGYLARIMIRDKTKIVLTAYDSNINYELKIENNLIN